MRRRTGRNHNRVRAGDLPDWTLIFADDFNYTHPVGSIVPNQQGVVTVPDLAGRFTFYADGWSTTHDGKVYPKTSGEPGFPGNWPAIVSKYYPSKTLSFANSMAQIRLHSELVGGVNTAMGATIKPIVPGGYKMGPYGRVSFRMRSTSVLAADGTNYSAAGNYTTGIRDYWNWVPLGIDSANWPSNGEFDFPEGGIDRAVAGNYHPAAATNITQHVDTVDAAHPNGLSPYEWHVYTWQWMPGRFQWIIDGTIYLDTTDRVPTLATAFLFQAESDWRQPTGEGLIQLDWVAIWSYTPGSIPGGGPAGPALTAYGLGAYGTGTYGV